MKNVKDIKIGIVRSSFRFEIAKNLEKHCLATLKQKGVKANQVTIVRVPGSWEIPLAAKKLAETKVYDAIITFGAIFKGKTYHFEQIANECARGCMTVALDYGLPVVFEVLAVYDPHDAIERATGKKENKGTEAALTALKMVDVLSKL